MGFVEQFEFGARGVQPAQRRGFEFAADFASTPGSRSILASSTSAPRRKRDLS